MAPRARVETIGLAVGNPGTPQVSCSYRAARHIEMLTVANYVTLGECIPLSNGVAGLEAEFGQWNDGIKTEVRAQSPREWAKA